ncbi:MAG: hypothetical protein AAFV62_11660, partial [Pseudomonadota bacterium]
MAAYQLSGVMAADCSLMIEGVEQREARPAGRRRAPVPREAVTGHRALSRKREAMSDASRPSKTRTGAATATDTTGAAEDAALLAAFAGGDQSAA